MNFKGAVRNPKHPKRDDQIKVAPIKDLAAIKTLKKLLAGSPRDPALFTMGINTNLRARDLLVIKVGQVQGLKPGDEIELKERKTGKTRRITRNKAVVKTLQDRLREGRYKNQDPVFRSQRGPVLTVPSVPRLVKGWCAAVGLRGNYGGHTLRKTWGYHQRVTFGVVKGGSEPPNTGSPIRLKTSQDATRFFSIRRIRRRK